MPAPLENSDHALCVGCVYHPPNLPAEAYPAADWALLQTRACAFEHAPGSPDCAGSRKTSCSLVALAGRSRA